MKRGFTSKIEGLDHIRTVLRELPKAAEKRAVRDSLIEAGEVFATEAARRAPRDRGDLQNSIVRTWRIIKSQLSGTRKPGKDGVRAFVGPNYSRTAAGDKGYAPHGHLVEFGTGPRYTKAGKFTGEMPAQPYMRPAFDTKKNEFIDVMSRALIERVNKAVAKLRKKRAKGK